MKSAPDPQSPAALFHPDTLEAADRYRRSSPRYPVRISTLGQLKSLVQDRLVTIGGSDPRVEKFYILGRTHTHEAIKALNRNQIIYMA